MRNTSWNVITGAPCSGKTSVIQMLESRGFSVIHEVARSIIDRQLAEGFSLDRIRADPFRFEHGILSEKLAIEDSLPHDEEIFFDRGMPDSIAYFQFEGLDTRAPTAGSRIRRYRRVFLMERLEFAPDPVRTEDAPVAARLEKLLIQSYQMLGYRIIRVPALCLDDRVEWILKHC